MSVKDLRLKKCMSQEQLAEKCGVSLRTIQRIEAGHRVGYRSMAAISSELNINVTELEQELDMVEQQSAEYKELPRWVKLYLCKGWLASSRNDHLNFEKFFITLGVISLVGWLTIWNTGGNFYYVKLLAATSSWAFLGAYNSALIIRIGDKYDVWSRLEATIPKGFFGIKFKQSL